MLTRTLSRNLNPTKHLLGRSFGYKYTNRTIIRPKEQPFIPYTREQIKQMRENPTFEVELKESQEQTQEEQIAKKHFDNFANDQNPKNHLELIIQNDSEAYDPIYEEITSSQKTPPFTVFHTTSNPLPYISGTYGNIKGSVKKLKPTVDLIKGMHLYDAMSTMEMTRKRAAAPIFRALNMVRNHALGVGLNQDHLWVKSIELQKKTRLKNIYYHAMGKSGILKRDFSRVKITLEEKSPEQIFKLFITGQAPNGLVKLWRQYFQENDYDLEDIRKFQFVLTSKGRQQRRLMIKRRAQKMQDDFLVSF